MKKLAFLIFTTQLIFSSSKGDFVIVNEDDVCSANDAAHSEYLAKGYLDDLDRASYYTLRARLAEIEEDKKVAQSAKNHKSEAFLKLAQKDIESHLEDRAARFYDKIADVILEGSSSASSAVCQFFGFSEK